MRNKFRKIAAIFLVLVLTLGTFNYSTDASDMGYGDSYGNIEDSTEDMLLTSKEYPSKNGIIYTYPGITGIELVGTFRDKDNVKINGAAATTNKVKTSNTVSLTADGRIVDEALIAVLGDIYADGACTISDISLLIGFILGTEGLSNIQYNAADLNKSNSISATDVVKMRNLILKSVDYLGLSPETGLYPTSRYVAAAYDSPMWAGNTVYQENAVVQKNASGTIDDIQLLYKIDEIVEVRNYGLNMVYEEGRDYQLTSDGKLRIPAGSSITAASVNAFLDPVQKPSNWLNTPQGVIVLYNNSDIHNYHISVTYKHSDTWKGVVPVDQSSKLDRFFGKLEKGEEVNMLFYGDSISTGLNASGCNESLEWKYDSDLKYTIYQKHTEKINVAPYAATWPRAVYNRTQAKYPDAKVNYINVASSQSTSTKHGIRNLQAAVIDNNPDIIFISFGTNEHTAAKATYKSSQKTMLEGITRVHPDCAIVFVSPTIPNLLYYGNNKFAAFQESFYELQAEYPNLDIAVAPVYSVAQYVNSIKKYQDITGNNVNHPNDFGVRIYSNTIMQTLGLY